MKLRQFVTCSAFLLITACSVRRAPSPRSEVSPAAPKWKEMTDEQLIDAMLIQESAPTDNSATVASEKDPIGDDFRAFDELIRRGRLAFPTLLKHLNDQRPSGVPLRAVTSPDSISYACFRILKCQILPFPAGYSRSLFRRGTDDRLHPRPGMDDHNPFNRENIGEWLAAREHRSITEIQIEGVQWLIAEEKKIGFHDSSESDLVLKPLEEELARLKKKSVQRSVRRIGASRDSERVIEVPQPDSRFRPILGY